jgi:hypothetical protein
MKAFSTSESDAVNDSFEIIFPRHSRIMASLLISWVANKAYGKKYKDKTMRRKQGTYEQKMKDRYKKKTQTQCIFKSRLDRKHDADLLILVELTRFYRRKCRGKQRGDIKE